MLNISVEIIKDGKEVYKMERAKNKKIWKAIIIAVATIGSFLLSGKQKIIVDAVEEAAVEIITGS